MESYLVVDGSKIGRVRPAVFAAISDFRAVISEAGVMPAATLGETGT